MRVALFTLSLVLMFTACSKPTFVWKSEAKSYLLMYQQKMFEGDSFQADFYYRDALKEARKGSSVKPIAMIYLTSCAMHQALFMSSNCVNYKKIKPVVKDDALDAYATFILGEKLEPKSVEKYAAVIEALSEKDQKDIYSSIESLKSIYSKAVAASVVAKKELLDERLIDYMIYEASKHSMKNLMNVWMQQKVKFLKKTGRDIERLRLMEQIRFLAH
ncbi:MAG: hypothetical protein OEW60_04595 [Thiovulaceae bacterium]|nr:hypothetical protein [Sulfurimonadaceae bacterium]